MKPEKYKCIMSYNFIIKMGKRNRYLPSFKVWGIEIIGSMYLEKFRLFSGLLILYQNVKWETNLDVLQ